MNKPKIDSVIRDRLFSADPEVVLAAIESLKEKGNSEYLPILFELLLAGAETEVRTSILKLLGTVKDKETIPVFVAALQNTKFKSIRKEMITACWQNGLDFSAHMAVFADLVIEETWEVAFEAFTVIENLEHFPPEEELKNIRLKIAGALKTADAQKQYFLEEILRM